MRTLAFIITLIFIVTFSPWCARVGEMRPVKRDFQAEAVIKKSGWTVPYSTGIGQGRGSVSEQAPRKDGSMTPITKAIYGDTGRLFIEEPSSDPAERHPCVEGQMVLYYVVEHKAGDNIFLYQVVASKAKPNGESCKSKMRERFSGYAIRDSDGDGVFETLLPYAAPVVVPDWALTRKEPTNINYSTEMGSVNEPRIDPLDAPRNTEYLRDQSKKVKIKNLRNTELPATTTEIRIWDAGGLIMPQCLIIKNENGKRSAKTVTPSGKNNSYVAKPLPAPKIGWEEFEKHIASQGISYPLDYTDEEYPTIANDLTQLIIEIKQGSDYDICVYNNYSDETYYDEKGRKLMAVSRFIDSQFK